MSIQTRSGIKPEQKEVLGFKITTLMAQDFIQNKVDAVINMMRSSGEQIEDVEINLCTMNFSKKFKPFVVTLPPNCRKSKGKKNNNDRELEMFNPTDNSKPIDLKNPFYQVFAPYIYTKDEENGFFSNTFRANLKITLSDAHELKHFRLPRALDGENSQNSPIAFILNPLAVFHDMLIDQANPNEKFAVDVIYTNDIEDGLCNYAIERVPLKKKGHKDKSKRGSILNNIRKQMRKHND